MTLVPAVRPLLVKAWILLTYSIPTSFLLLFATAYGLQAAAGPQAAQQGGPPVVALGNPELVGLVVTLGILVLLNMGTAVQYWLDVRKTEVFVRFLSGSSQADVVARLVWAVLVTNFAGFVAATAVYVVVGVVARTRVPIPPVTFASVALALATCSILMVIATAAGVIGASRRLERTGVY